MPRRRAPALALLLALAIVAYPVTMPLAMAAETATPAHAAMHGGEHCPPSPRPAPHHHHALSSCCTGVCGSCPVVAITAGITPRVQAATRFVAGRNAALVVLQLSARLRLPFSIGPPPPASLV